ncbi:hypothetical protein Anapl_08640 [Anas platyrhynchos]|uniref:Uncharacterized protein n=1 Tax=Anas platyrhynchos TaxID=8839 RepID=R0KD85_ANAPL|nr:hypothetical protein Anapl_08640 [Anas platyrhynchos]
MSSTEPEVLAEHVPHDLEPRSQSPSSSSFLRGNSLLPPGPGIQEGDAVYAIRCNEVEILGKALKNRKAVFLKPGAGGAGSSGCYQQEPTGRGTTPRLAARA